MQRLLAALLLIVLVLSCAGCGDVFFRGAIQLGFSTVNGFVSILQVSTDNGTTITFVTFLSNGTSSTFGFCGDQRRRFPINQNVRTQFSPGTPCNSIITIVIL
ncbi:MAG TPA: hypothetical protein VIW67_25155 [Terriglobales bacterium]